MTTEPIGGERYFVAGLVAAMVAPLPFSVLLFAGMPDGGLLGFVAALFFVMLFGVPIAFVHFVVLALPAYLALRRWWRPGWLASIVAGLLIGALPMGFVSGDWEGVGFGGACGVTGGLVFWLALRGISPPPSPDMDAAIFG